MELKIPQLTLAKIAQTVNTVNTRSEHYWQNDLFKENIDYITIFLLEKDITQKAFDNNILTLCSMEMKLTTTFHVKFTLCYKYPVVNVS